MPVNIMSNESKKKRIAKIIAESGVCSRRQAEKLIISGKVFVNSIKINTFCADLIFFNHKIIFN